MKKTLALALLLSGLGLSNSALADDSDKPAGIAYKDVNIVLGGFLASETVLRNNNMASDLGTTFNKIPFSNGAGNGVSEFRGSERQSRFSLLATGNVDSDTKVAGYYEVDFFGTTPSSNANESNSYAPRTRNVYMQGDWENSGWHMLAGQNWSLVTLNKTGITPRSEYVPPTIDAQYAVGFNWARQWQFRVVKDWDKKWWLGVSLENAQTANVGGAGGANNTTTLPAGNLMSAPMSLNSYPDLVVKFAADPGYGHYEVYGLARNFKDRYGTGGLATQTSVQDSWTEAFGAGVIVPVIKEKLDVAVSGLFGKGAGRYGTSQLADATYASDASLAPLNGTQYLVQLAWHANANWEAYAHYGQESVSGSTGTGFGYGDGVVASNSGCNTLGGACAPNLKDVSQYGVGFWWTFYKGGYGAAKFGGQYSHTQLDTFADATGLAPTTKEDMVFTSLRFYPF